jgi:hypothetical protein
METCDFSRSFITFVTQNKTNNARIQVESRCILTDKRSGKSETYYLVASCKGEDTYGKGCLFLMPNYDFCMIYSSKDFMIIRTHSNAEQDNTTVGDNKGHFLDVHFDIKLVDGKKLDCNEEIVKATFENYVLNGQTEIWNNDYLAVIEFPIKTMNVNDINMMYQVDTGPVLLPDFTSKKERMVERFNLAYVAYNKPVEAYFVVQEPTSIEDESDYKVSHYSRITRFDASNSVICIDDN